MGERSEANHQRVATAHAHGLEIACSQQRAINSEVRKVLEVEWRALIVGCRDSGHGGAEELKALVQKQPTNKRKLQQCFRAHSTSEPLEPSGCLKIWLI